MSQVQAPGVQESSSRPTTQNSIQSSNPSLLKPNHETSYQTSFFNKDDYAFFRSEESSADIINELENSKTEVLDFDQLSPLHDFKQSTNIQLSSGLEFLNEIPSSCVEFAYKKISSELCTGVSAFANSEYTSSSKLTPCTIKYGDFSPTTKNSYHRKFAIEEIIETEETYISSLKMLSGIYLGSLITKGSDGVPIKLLHSYIESLITNHQSFLKDLRSLFYFYLRSSITNNLSPGLRTRAEELLSCSSPLMAALVSQLIAEKAISLYFYQELSCLHELVLRLMAAKESDPEFGSTLTKGYQLFLEATQGSNSRMDLSFSSLIQKPISRIGKYKLFVENLLKLTPISEDPLCHSKIELSLHQIDDRIELVNRYGLEEKFKANSLFQNLVFGVKTLKFPVEYLGLPILLGSLHCVWVGKERQVHAQLLGAFLFKTHLVLAHISKLNRYEVRFLIPLSICKVVDNSDMMGGLFTNYKHSFKLIFEHDYTLIELLCLQYDEMECEVWKNKLNILVNYVNGPYKFDYSSSATNEEMGTHCSTILPQFTQSFDAKLNRLSSVRIKNEKNSIFTQCYFSDIIPIMVQQIGSNEESWKSHRILSDPTRPRNVGTLIQLKEVDQARIEYLLQDLWSNELVTNAILTRRKQSTKKTGSRLHKHSPSRSLRSSFTFRSNQPIESEENNDLSEPIENTADNEDTVIVSNEGSPTRSTSRVSIFRRTSIVFGGAFKSVMNNEH